MIDLARRRLPGRAWFILGAIAVAWTVIAFVLLPRNALYSGDSGIKFVQARSLWASGFRSLAIPPRAQFVDPENRYVPFRPPFAFQTRAGLQAIFPPAGTILEAPFVAGGDVAGLRALALCAGVIVLWAAWRLTPSGDAPWVVPVLAFATPLWFYSVNESEHAPALAFATLAFLCAWRRPSNGAAFVAGALLGAGSAVRDEVVLLLPGLLFAVWWQTRSWRSVFLAGTGAAAVILGSVVVDVWWFQRPPAAHAQHAAHLLRRALGLTSEVDPELPQLEVLTWRDRYDTVVQYWLLGYGNNAMTAVFATLLAIGLAARIFWNRDAPLLIALAAFVWLAGGEAIRLLQAPRWVAGLQRLAPFLLFALVPPPRGRDDLRGFAVVSLVAFTAFVAIAFLGTDTTGGKSLGPRLLLPLLPVLTIAATVNVAAYVRSRLRSERWLGYAGAALVVAAGAIHLGSTIPAYVGRLRETAAVLDLLKQSDARIWVADEAITAQFLLPYYYRRTILLAESADTGVELGPVLDRLRVPSVLLVSRDAHPRFSMRPLHRVSQIHKAQFVVEEWRR